MVLVDYFSRYPKIVYVPDLTSRTVISKLKSIFARWGIPKTLISDNGPPFFSEEFRSFSTKFGFDHVTSSPYYPQANGEAESGVKIAKRILKQDDPFIALMAYRATPIAATGVSPSQLIMGRQIRTTVPMLTSNLLPTWPDLSTVREADKKMKERYSAYNRKHGARYLSFMRFSSASTRGSMGNGMRLGVFTQKGVILSFNRILTGSQFINPISPNTL